jgi:hypothetical protein
VLRLAAGPKLIDHLVGRGVDHRHRVALAIRYVNAGRIISYHGAKLPGTVGCVNVICPQDRRHAREQACVLDRGAGLTFKIVRLPVTGPLCPAGAGKSCHKSESQCKKSHVDRHGFDGEDRELVWLLAWLDM